MKRKLSALLAIVLAVVMVFPTAVFVGADGPADLKGITVKVTGYSDATNKDITKTTDSVEIAVGGAITISAEAKSGYTISDAKIENPSGTIEYDASGNTFNIEGMREGVKNAVITYTVKGSDSGNLIETCQINIVCKDAEIDGTVEVAFKDGNNVFDPNEEIDISKKEIVVSGKLTNGKDIITTVTGVKSARDKEYSGKTNVIGGDSEISVQYNIENEEYKKTNEKISLPVTVKAQEIDNITAKLKKDQPLAYNDTFNADGLMSLITVYANYKNGDSPIIDSYDIEIKRNDEKVFTIDYKTFETYKEEYVVEITYQGYKEKLSFENILDGKTLFSISTPFSFELDVSGLKIKDYIEGQTIKDFTGAVLTVYDSENVPIDHYSFKDNDIAELNLELTGFKYGDKSIVATLTIGGKTMESSVSVSSFKITKKQVISIAESSASTMDKTYTAGDSLSLNGLKLTLTYNSGETEDIPYNNSQVTCNPKNGDELTTSDKTVMVAYADPNTGYERTTSIDITVSAKAAEKNTVKEVKLLSSASAKREYFIGEAFDPEGFEFLIVYSDATTEVKDLYTYRGSLTIDSTKYSASNKQFTAAMNGDLKVNFNISHNSTNYKVTLTIPNIVVTKRPVLQSIVADCIKDTYMVGDMPEVQQFTITAKYDDNSTRVFQFADDVTDTEKAKSTFTDTIGGVVYTIKVTPTRIEEDTDAIRVSYSEKVSGSGSTVTKYDDVEIEVVVPDAILSYYDGGWRTKAYMDFDEALDAAEEYADQLTSSYQQSRKPSIQLCKDITVLYDYSVKEYMEIDLNGFDLIMVPGEIFVKSTSTAELTFVNTGDEDSQIIYSKTNEDDNIIIAENDTYTIDANSGDGKYEVTITKPTNGKVTGPDEVTHGHDAKFTITPNEDYEVKTITVKEGKNTKKYDNKDNVVTVKDVQGALTITVTFQEKAWENPFSDVYKSATYYKSIQFVYENGLFSGMSATKFEPDTTMTRAMFVTVLGRLAGIDADEAASRYGTTSSFSDVSATDASISYAVPYIKWATDNGLIEGYGNGKFGPKDNITHIQMYVLMQRYAAFIERLNTSATGTNIPANDVKDIPTWAGAYEAVEYAAKKQFLVTSSNRLTPNGNAKRAELAMLLEKFCTNVLEWDK